MMKLTTRLAFSAALALSAALPALAQVEPEQALEALERADANSDGHISWAEVVDMRSGIFERLDRNADGLADQGDRPRFGRARFDEAFARMSARFDANGDGAITRSEMLDGPSGAFVEADLDADGILTPDELEGFRSDAAAARTP